jgi:hypothetical protein
MSNAKCNIAKKAFGKHVNSNSVTSLHSLFIRCVGSYKYRCNVAEHRPKNHVCDVSWNEHQLFLLATVSRNVTISIPVHPEETVTHSGNTAFFKVYFPIYSKIRISTEIQLFELKVRAIIITFATATGKYGKFKWDPLQIKLKTWLNIFRHINYAIVSEVIAKHHVLEHDMFSQSE